MVKRTLLFWALVAVVLFGHGQRQYASNTVLRSGKWIKVAVDSPGVYKVDAAYLTKAGFAAAIPSRSIKLYGNGGGVLPESNAGNYQDDLAENAIMVVDGGDGIFDGSDYFLFYAPGPNQWVFDTASSSFTFSKNPYSNSACYFITQASGEGKRIQSVQSTAAPNNRVDLFDEHYHHELDSLNLLNSGKEWFGEDLSNLPGRRSLREFTLGLPGIVAGKSFTLVSELAGRSSGQANRIPVSVNDQLLFEHTTPALMGTLLEPFANLNRRSASAVLNDQRIKVTYRFNGGSVNAEAWLNWFDLFFVRDLSVQGVTQLHFRATGSVGPQAQSLFTIKAASDLVGVWDVTDPIHPQQQQTSRVGTGVQFSCSTAVLKEFIAFKASYPSPTLMGEPANQDLHAMGAQDMVIVSDKSMVAAASRLAAFHQQLDGMRTQVVDVEQVYNEFGGGTPDPTAIRNFMKMLYDRAGNTVANRPQYLLLFGGASYVYKEKKGTKKNLIPSYQSAASLDPLTSYVSDDYFGLLDDQDDINNNQPVALLDLGIGRIPVRTPEQADLAVDKLIRYHLPANQGDWRNTITLVADDEDFNLHFSDAELHAALINAAAPAVQLQKIYLDAFDQEGGSGGSAYPAVKEAITKGIERGTLMWNYSGHGGSERLAQEAILDRATVASWKNQNKLPLFLTATCDFAPFDNPNQFSLGEDLLVGRSNGAIGLLTTTRLVFASSNRVINNNFFRFQLKKDSNHRYPSLGESLLLSKNFTVVNTGDYLNVRKFTLLGDPAMRLAFPTHTVMTTTINGRPITATDTLKALNRYTVTGEVRRPDGMIAADFNGQVYPKVYDIAAVLQTKGNDPTSRVAPFEAWQHLVYDGKVRAEQGRFTYSFVVPKDISVQFGKARISYYAENGVVDASGVEARLLAGGIGNTVSNDGAGPRIEAFLNTEQFKNGDLVNENPLLMVNLFDATGINISGVGIGHDITAVIDGNYRETISLNTFFEPGSGELRGTIRFLMPTLSEGKHTIEIKAWDVFNNSNTLMIDCRVEKQTVILIKALSNYPNPFSNSTRFRYLLEGPVVGAVATVQVFTVEGRQVRSFSKTINEATERFISLDWDGRDERGNTMAPGIYVYQLLVRGSLGQLSQKMRKLIIH